MKNARLIASLFLLALLCAALSSCFFFGDPAPWEEDKLRDIFFSAEYLEERGVGPYLGHSRDTPLVLRRDNPEKVR